MKSLERSCRTNQLCPTHWQKHTVAPLLQEQECLTEHLSRTRWCRTLLASWVVMLGRRTSTRWTSSLTHRNISEHCQRYATTSSRRNSSSALSRFLQKRQLKIEVHVSSRTPSKITSSFSLRSRVESNPCNRQLPSLVELKLKVKSSRPGIHQGNSRKSNYLISASEACKICKKSHSEKCRSSRLKSSRKTRREEIGQRLIRARVH